MSRRAVSIERMLRPFEEFAKVEASGGIVLLLCTVMALLWANSPFSDRYTALWQTTVTVGVGNLVLAKPLFSWINDGLMAIFFFVVGLDTDAFLARSRATLGAFARAGHSREDQFITENHRTALRSLNRDVVHVQTPMERLEHALHPWISFGVMRCSLWPTPESR